MKNLINVLVLLVLSLFINACSSKTYTVEIHKKKEPIGSSKKIALFLDGTANNRDSRTNVSKLFEIVSNQNKDNLYTFYNEGVGTTKDRILGLGYGVGFGNDIKQAYEFLTKYYDDNSKLYIFGFSRGSYTARALAGMIYSVGIYDLSAFEIKNRDNSIDYSIIRNIINELYYDAYKSFLSSREKSKEDIVKDSNEIIKKWKELKNIKTKINVNRKVEIEVLGIWDTVEALGPKTTLEAIGDKFLGIKDEQIIVKPNKKYFDQICNIKKVYHALSLDDNRSYVFTPIILTSKEYKSYCHDKNIEDTVNEVWFAGAHADIGGGYKKDNDLAGVSLNWMIKEIIKQEKDGLIDKDYTGYSNIWGMIHDAENSISLAYREKSRIDILKKYLIKSDYKKIKIHSSVKKRLENPEKIDSNSFKSIWYKDEYFSSCLTEKGIFKKILNKNCKIEVVD